MNDLDGSKLSLGQSMILLGFLLALVSTVGFIGYHMFIEINDNDTQPPPIDTIRYIDLPIDFTAKSTSKHSKQRVYVANTISDNISYTNSTFIDPPILYTIDGSTVYIELPYGIDCNHISDNIRELKCSLKLRKDKFKQQPIGLEVEHD